MHTLIGPVRIQLVTTYLCCEQAENAQCDSLRERVYEACGRGGWAVYARGRRQQSHLANAHPLILAAQLAAHAH